CQQLYTNPLTF
nr:immunoglobulin light chain junction region [Macaca mulatta]